MRSKQTHVDEVSSTVTYIGVSSSKGLDSDPIWKINRITDLTGGDWDIEQPTDVSFGNGVWDDRTTYNYG